jgi:hypothetical protein
VLDLVDPPGRRGLHPRREARGGGRPVPDRTARAGSPRVTCSGGAIRRSTPHLGPPSYLDGKKGESRVEGVMQIDRSTFRPLAEGGKTNF